MKSMTRGWAFLVVATTLWNSLPVEVCQATASIQKFTQNTPVQRSLSRYLPYTMAYYIIYFNFILTAVATREYLGLFFFDCSTVVGLGVGVFMFISL